MEHRIINTMIVDDEIEACNNLAHLLTNNNEQQINILGFAHNTKDAEEKIRNLKPDVVFLDIEMPNENAFQFLSRLERIDFEIIFVTAYDEYAIKAFKLNALGYILKPIDITDLMKVVKILHERLMVTNLLVQRSQDGRNDLFQKLQQKSPPFQLVLNDANQWESVPFANIFYIQASGSYSKVFYTNKSGASSRIVSKAISDYEELLPRESFFRVHKSYLVNCSYIKKIQKGENKQIEMMDDTLIPIGRRRYTDFLEFMKNK